MTLAELIEHALFLMGDPNGERYASADVEAEVKLSVADFALRTEMTKDRVVFQVLEDVWAYDVAAAITQQNIDGASLHEYAWPLRLGYYGDERVGRPGTSLQAIDLAAGVTAMSAASYDWSDVAGGGSSIQLDRGTYPRAWHRDSLGANLIGLYPVPSEDGEALPSEDGNVNCTYVGLPDPMATSSDEPDSAIPEQYHETVCKRVAALFLLGSPNDSDVSQAFQLLAEYEGDCAEAVGDSYRSLSRGQGVWPT